LAPRGRPLSRREEGFGWPLAGLQEDMNRLFDQFYSGSLSSLTDWNGDTISAPSVNVIEDEKSFRVEAELAGIEPKNVEVEVARGLLILKGERHRQENREEKNYLRREISYGSFTRKVALPETADSEKAKATFSNGLLTVDIPKIPAAQQKSRKIEIKSNIERPDPKKSN
jgi:HSP20 family protein